MSLHTHSQAERTYQALEDRIQEARIAHVYQAGSQTIHALAYLVAYILTSVVFRSPAVAVLWAPVPLMLGMLILIFCALPIIPGLSIIPVVHRHWWARVMIVVHGDAMGVLRHGHFGCPGCFGAFGGPVSRGGRRHTSHGRQYSPIRISTVSKAQTAFQLLEAPTSKWILVTTASSGSPCREDACTTTFHI